MLSTGDQFPSFKEFKAAVADWSIKEKFFYNVYKSDKVRTIIRCRAVACSFTVRAFWKMEEDIVEVGKVDPIHICYGSGESQGAAIASIPQGTICDSSSCRISLGKVPRSSLEEK